MVPRLQLSLLLAWLLVAWPAPVGWLAQSLVTEVGKTHGPEVLLPDLLLPWVPGPAA